jgi:hypothetical protein
MSSERFIIFGDRTCAKTLRLKTFGGTKMLVPLAKWEASH